MDSLNKKTEPNKVGRPSDYTQWKDRAICMRLSMGESMRSICERKYYPSRYAVMRWLRVNGEFRNHYVQAREMQAEYYLDDIIDISDDVSGDYDENTGRFIGENVQRSRLRVDTRKWAMERMAAKKYGSSQNIDHTSSDGSMSPPKTYTPEQYAKAQAEIELSVKGLD